MSATDVNALARLLGHPTALRNNPKRIELPSRVLDEDTWVKALLALDGVADTTTDGAEAAEVAGCEPPAIWQGVIPSGRLTLLAGESKAGKTTFVKAMFRAMQAAKDGGPEVGNFLGRDLDWHRVLVATEQKAADWAGAPGLVRIQSAQGLSVVGKAWREQVEAWGKIANARGCHLLVIDTISRLWGGNENDAQQVTRAMTPLRDLCEQGLSVLLLHHTNRNGGVRGSTALSAQSDTVLTLTRVTDDLTDRRRRLTGVGREIAPVDLTYRLYADDKTLVLDGPPAPKAGKAARVARKPAAVGGESWG